MKKRLTRDNRTPYDGLIQEWEQAQTQEAKAEIIAKSGLPRSTFHYYVVKKRTKNAQQNIIQTISIQPGLIGFIKTIYQLCREISGFQRIACGNVDANRTATLQLIWLTPNLDMPSNETAINPSNSGVKS
jgi:hypothetical protein